MKKRLFSLALALCMCLGLLPGPAFAMEPIPDESSLTAVTLTMPSVKAGDNQAATVQVPQEDQDKYTATITDWTPQTQIGVPGEYVFQEGVSYTVTVKIEPKNNYRLFSRMTATMNGQPMEKVVIHASGTFAQFKYTLPAVVADPKVTADYTILYELRDITGYGYDTVEQVTASGVAGRLTDVTADKQYEGFVPQKEIIQYPIAKSGKTTVRVRYDRAQCPVYLDGVRHDVQYGLEFRQAFPEEPTRENESFVGWVQENGDLYCDYNPVTGPLKLTSLWVKHPDNIQINEKNFPDKNFRAFVKTLPGAEDNVFSRAELRAVTELDLTGFMRKTDKRIGDLTGIGYFTALKTLYCNETTIEKMDFSNNPELEHIGCNQCGTKELNIHYNPRVKYLDFDTSRLTSIDLSSMFNMEEMYCGRSRLESLDLSQARKLNFLNCVENNLACLDVSKTQIRSADRIWHEKNTRAVADGASIKSVVPEIDLSRISNVKGGKIQSGKLIYNPGSEKVTYTYDAGKNILVEFAFVLPPAPMIPVHFNAGSGQGGPGSLEFEQGTNLNFNNLPRPEHAPVDGKAVAFYGWTNAPYDKILAFGETGPRLYDELTVMKETTYYAVYGYDIDRNGVADVGEERRLAKIQIKLDGKLLPDSMAYDTMLPVNITDKTVQYSFEPIYWDQFGNRLNIALAIQVKNQRGGIAYNEPGKIDVLPKSQAGDFIFLVLPSEKDAEKYGWQGDPVTVRIGVDGEMVTYDVHHLVQRLDGKYDLVEEVQLKGIVGYKTEAKAQNRPGFTAQPFEQKTIADMGTVVEIKYNRNLYTLTWNLEGGKPSGDYTHGEVPFETIITAPTLTRDGYTFAGWDKEVPYRMPASDLTITAKWTKNTPEPSDPTKPVDPEPSDPTKPVDPKPSDPTKPVDPKPSDPTKPVDPKPSDPTKPVDPEPTDPVPPKPLVNPFTDVKESDYYYYPVLWAVDRGITSGSSATTFSPDLICTRSQAVTFLWSKAGKPEPKSMENPFSDISKDDYFYKAALWARENDITAGIGNGKFGPEVRCTRSQIVTFLWSMNGRPAPKSQTIPFSDVKKDDYFCQAVLWAVENGITAGSGGNTFSPLMNCTRGQIVTFLWRDAGSPKN